MEEEKELLRIDLQTINNNKNTQYLLATRGTTSDKVHSVAPGEDSFLIPALINLYFL